MSFSLSTPPDLQAALTQLDGVILGKGTQVRLAVACLLARGHLLIEDQPGVGKTTLAHALARTFGLDFRRVQFTSDLLPADLLGVSIWDAARPPVRVPPGPGFSAVGLAEHHLPWPAGPGDQRGAARRRDQPRHAPHAGRAAGGHGGAAGVRGRHHPPAAGPVLRDRHAEPGGVRGHLAAAGSAAGPLPAHGDAGLPGRPGRAAAAGNGRPRAARA